MTCPARPSTGPERVEPAQVEHDLAVQRHGAADEAGVAALGHDGRAGVAARAQHRRDLVDRARANDRGRRSGEATGPVAHLTGHDIGIGEHVRVADRDPQRAEQRLRAGHPRSVRRCQDQDRADPPGESLRGQLLVATPPLVDPNFDRSVVLLLEHGEDGALGIILNRPTDATLASVLPEWHAHASAPAVVFSGGPVAPEAVIALARGGHDAAPGWVSVLGEVGTVDVGRDPADLGRSRSTALRVFVGYAGWAPGQLEAELDQDAWFVVATAADGSVLDRSRSTSGATCCAASAAGSRCSPTIPTTPRSTSTGGIIVALD